MGAGGSFRSWATVVVAGVGCCSWVLGLCSWVLGCRSQVVGFVRVVGLFVPAGLSFMGAVVMCRVLGGHP